MTNAIELKKPKTELAWNGKRVRLSKEDLSRALAPIFATFPGLEMGPDTFNAYYMMLCDLDADKLAVAVIQACQAHKYPTQLITVAAIREAYDNDGQWPGERGQVDFDSLPPARTRMHQLSPEEDYRQRMERLRQTRKYDKYYA